MGTWVYIGNVARYAADDNNGVWVREAYVGKKKKESWLRKEKVLESES